MALTVFVVAALLTLGFVGTRLASALKVPHSVFLVFLGVTVGILLRSEGGPFASFHLPFH